MKALATNDPAAALRNASNWACYINACNGQTSWPCNGQTSWPF